MGGDRRAVAQACARLDEEFRTRPELAHMSHFRVDVDGDTIIDAHYRGPEVADVFSVTKSVVATLAGIAVLDGRLPHLDLPVEQVLDVGGTPSAGQTLRHLLTMTRGSSIEGPYDIDAVMALPRGWVDRIAAAPQVEAAGTGFRYDNGAAHLFGAALTTLLGTSLAEYADERLFGPLGITRWSWPRDPDGFDYGFGHLQLAADGLAGLGRLWLQGGECDGTQLADPGFVRLMTSAQSPGGPPEGCGYGYLVWVGDAGAFAGGWAGQHVSVISEARAVVVTTGDPGFDPGPPPTDTLPPGWRPGRELVDELLVPVLRGR